MGRSALRPIVVLGATGSIGTQTLDVATRLGLEVVGLATHRVTPRLIELAAEFPESRLAVADTASEAREAVPGHLVGRTAFGSSAVAELARTPDTIVVNGIVGAAGLRPSVAALESGNRLALANKESLVAGGPVVREAENEGGGELIPIDSEHSAIWQCLIGEDRARISKLVLTASGGPFRKTPAAALADVSVADALAHPVWNMGPRITVDSATLMNKGFEVIEAHFLFGVSFDAIEVVVHPQGMVHSLVEFDDGSVKAELGEADMRVPIQYALTYPERAPAPAAGLSLVGAELTFERPDGQRFPCLELGYEAGRQGGSAPAVLNAADEVAVAAFLEKRLPFPGIAASIEETLRRSTVADVVTVDDVLAADAEGRVVAAEVIGELARSHR